MQKILRPRKAITVMIIKDGDDKLQIKNITYLQTFLKEDITID